MKNNNRNSFVFYCDWYEAINELDTDLRVEVYDAIMSEVFKNEQKHLSPMAEMAMKFIRPQLLRDKDKWLEIREKREKSGRQGGFSKGKQIKQELANVANAKFANQNKQELAKKASEAVNVNVDVNVNGDNNDVIKEEDTNVSKKKGKKEFVPPTLEEVEAYIKEKGYHFNAKSFIDYYEADDWHYGQGANRKKVANWKRCCSTWEEKRSNNQPDFFDESETIESNELIIDGQVYR